MLGRAGIDAVVVDPHVVYPPDFRCEKLDGSQVAVLRKTGLAEAALDAATHDGAAWVVRRGRVIDRRPSDQQGIMYDTLVNRIRAEIPVRTTFVHAKVVDIATGAERQRLTLSNGEEVSARLVVLANGLNVSLRDQLGLSRDVVSPCHSISAGFDLKPVGRAAFDFPALTYYPERTSDRLAYLTLFPIGTSMRANLMVYRDMDDPWFRTLRQTPREALIALMPGLERATGSFEVVGPVKIRPADLYDTHGHRQAGVVLVGDAFGTSCPAAGTGTSKVFTDVERLCNIYIPRWLATPGMGADKIAAFYDDPVKRACDRDSRAKAYSLRSLSIDDGWAWRLRRAVRFAARLGVGLARQLRRRLTGQAIAPHPAPAAATIALKRAA
jgi:2-polyprenyl-6-methoxyphenol hydroxylase-like FAD-dependent oxidoreductase